MTPEKFAQAYLKHEEYIKKVLRSLKIYDDDLLHDTYIALYEHRNPGNGTTNAP